MEKETEENSLFLSGKVEHGQEPERTEQVTVVPSDAHWKTEHQMGPQQQMQFRAAVYSTERLKTRVSLALSYYVMTVLVTKQYLATAKSLQWKPQSGPATRNLDTTPWRHWAAYNNDQRPMPHCTGFSAN